MFVIWVYKICLNVELLHFTISFVSLVLRVVNSSKIGSFIFLDKRGQVLLIKLVCFSDSLHIISNFHFYNLFKCSLDWASDEIQYHSFHYVDSYVCIYTISPVFYMKLIDIFYNPKSSCKFNS